MKYFLIVFFSLLFIKVAFPSELGSKGEFEIEKGLLDKIYQETISDSGVKSSMHSGLEIVPQFNYSFVDQLNLSNDYFTVPYTASTKSIPFFSLLVSLPLLNYHGIGLQGNARVGYSFKESVTQVTSKSGGDYSDIVRLHWLPASLGLKIDYQIPKFSSVRPFIEGGVGAQWLYQSGNLSGLEQGFWIPFYQTTLGLVLFGNSNFDHWFGGIVMSFSWRNSFASDQSVKTRSIDAGVNFRL
jgi:hypothetical protein